MVGSLCEMESRLQKSLFGVSHMSFGYGTLHDWKLYI